MVGKFEPLLTTIKRRKMSYYGHICRHNSLANTIMQGQVEGARSRGRPKKDWMSNITLWTNKSLDELLEKTRDRQMEKSCYCCKQHDSPYDACVTGLKVKVSNIPLDKLYIIDESIRQIQLHYL